VHNIAGGDVRIDVVDPRRLTALEAYESVFAYRQKLYIEKKHFSGTGNLAMGREVHAAVGPFAGIDVAEDMDWGARATTAGYHIQYVEPMRIYHPARTSFAELQRKWRRHIAHDLNAHRADARPAWRWLAQALVVLASIPVHAVMLLNSDRLHGIGNRWRGITMLIRIRLWRVAAMLQAATGGAVSGGAYWTTAP
jgi:GT2 family glycosyltransferase